MTHAKRKIVFRFPTRSDTNQAVQAQQMVRLEIFYLGSRGFVLTELKIKALISCAVTAQMNCALVFAFAL